MTAAVCSGAAAAELSLWSVTVTQGTAAKRLRMGSTGRDALKKSLFILRVFFFLTKKMPFLEWKVSHWSSMGWGCATCLQPPIPMVCTLLGASSCSQTEMWQEWSPEFLPTCTHCALHTLTQSQFPQSALLHRESHVKSKQETPQQSKNGAVQLGLWQHHQ